MLPSLNIIRGHTFLNDGSKADTAVGGPSSSLEASSSRTPISSAAMTIDQEQTGSEQLEILAKEQIQSHKSQRINKYYNVISEPAASISGVLPNRKFPIRSPGFYTLIPAAYNYRERFHQSVRQKGLVG